MPEAGKPPEIATNTCPRAWDKVTYTTKDDGAADEDDDVKVWGFYYPASGCASFHGSNKMDRLKLIPVLLRHLLNLLCRHKLIPPL